MVSEAVDAAALCWNVTTRFDAIVESTAAEFI